MTDYYKVLGVAAQADEKELKAAYRKLAKTYHPDAIKDRPELADKMYEIQEAYEVLGDPEKRLKYDERLKQRAGKAGKEGQAQGQASSGNMSPFEQFFGFQAGKGMETYQDRRQSAKKSGGPINPEDLFAAYFGKGK